MGTNPPQLNLLKPKGRTPYGLGAGEQESGLKGPPR